MHLRSRQVRNKRTPVEVSTPGDGPFSFVDPASWGGGAPQTGDVASITGGKTFIYDETRYLTGPNLAEIEIDGVGSTLIISNSVDTFLRTHTVTLMNGGQLLSGSASTPNTRKHVREMTGSSKVGVVRGFTNDPNTNAPTGNDGLGNNDFGVHRGLLLNDGCRYEMHFARPSGGTRAKLNGFHASGTSTINMDRDVEALGWQVGGLVSLPPTGFWGTGTQRTERFTILTVVGSTITIDGTLGYARWGQLQYPRDDKTISLTPGAFTTGPGGMRASMDVPNVLDERGDVFYLTRLGVVQGANDSVWTGDGDGAVEMYMGLGCTVVVKGVMYQRVGHSGVLGAYPIHHHRNAYNNDNTLRTNPLTGLADGKFAPGQAVHEDCVVLDSMNRVHSAHACKGVLFKNILADNIRGHGFFQEDGPEEENTWDSCFVTRCDAPAVGRRIKVHDGATDAFQTAGWWIVNAKNNFISTYGKNGAADCAGSGVILAAGTRCFGLSATAPVNPGRNPPANWTGFETHSCGAQGKTASFQIIDEAGNQQQSDRDNATKPFDSNGEETASLFAGDFHWKQQGSPYGNNQYHPVYKGWIEADNGYDAFSGNTNFGEIESVLFIEKSLNTTGPAYSGPPRRGLISYHGQLVPRNCSVFGYAGKGVPIVQTNRDRFDGMLILSGPVWMASTDTYLFPEIGFSKGMTNIRHSETGPMVYMTPHPSFQLVAPWTTWTGGGDLTGNSSPRGGSGAAAWWDYEGTLFKTGADRFATLDHPALTTGCENLLPVPSADGNYLAMKTTTTRMFGMQCVGGIVREDGVAIQNHKIGIQRVDPATLADISGAFVVMNNAEGRDGGNNWMFNLPVNHAAIRLYDSEAPSSKFRSMPLVQLESPLQTGFTYIIGVPWDNSRAFFANGYGQSAVSVSKAEMLASAGGAYWRDTANSIVWTKFFYNGLGISNDGYTSNGTLFHGYFTSHMEISFTS